MRKFLKIYFPFIVLSFSIIFLVQGNSFYIWGIILLLLAVQSITEMKLTGTQEPEDERIEEVRKRAMGIAYSVTISAIIVLLVIHYFFIELGASFVLNSLLVTGFLSYPIASIFINRNT